MKAIRKLVSVARQGEVPDAMLLRDAEAEVEALVREERVNNAAFSLLELWTKTGTVAKARELARNMEQAVREALAKRTTP